MSATEQLTRPEVPPAASRTPTVAPPVEERVYRQLFDRESLSEYLRISTDTIDRLVKAGKLQCVRIGSQVRFTIEDVEAFINRHRTPVGEPR
jgi:excisionase family DNA binding protein